MARPDRSPQRDSHRPSLTPEGDGLAFVGEGGRATLRWSDVKEIVAFKRDAFAHDLICIAFRVSAAGEWWEIHEEMPGYQEILAALPAAFPGIRTDWWHAVAFPAFETNATLLWNAAGEESSR